MGRGSDVGGVGGGSDVCGVGGWWKVVCFLIRIVSDHSSLAFARVGFLSRMVTAVSRYLNYVIDVPRALLWSFLTMGGERGS